MITNKNYNVDPANLSDKNLMFDFAKETNFDVKAQGKESNRDKTLIKIHSSPGLWVSASVVSKTIFLPSDPNDICNRLNFSLQEKQSGVNSNKINE